jgi:hypothetical protein
MNQLAMTAFARALFYEPGRAQSPDQFTPGQRTL